MLLFFLSGEGAGSGGSIWITTKEFGGHGIGSTNGGLGHQYGAFYSGSGSGGRIAVHISSLNHFRGSLIAVGGTGNGVAAGGPGTVFIETKTGFTYHRKLIVDGNYANPAKPLVISERNPSTLRENIAELNNATYGFDDVEIWKEVKVFLTLMPYFVIRRDTWLFALMME